MRLYINGQSHDLPESLKIEDLLDHLGYQNRNLAVAINQVFVPQQNFAEAKLAEGDAIEILAPMAGG